MRSNSRQPKGKRQVPADNGEPRTAKAEKQPRSRSKPKPKAEIQEPIRDVWRATLAEVAH